MANYHQKTFQEKQEEVKKLTESMDRAIENYFVSPEKMTQYLHFMSQFYRYSPGNMALIHSQFEGAQGVGSFKFWKDKGYNVIKGEHGIKLWVPVRLAPKYQNEQGEWKPIKEASPTERIKIQSGTLKSVPERTGFTTGHVFDISQTNCPPEKIPELFPNRHTPGEIKDFEAYLKGLHGVAKYLEVEILPHPPYELGAAKGAYFPDEHVLALNPRDTDFERATVLAHELAHAALHSKENEGRKLSTAEKEFQAEMTAYVVNEHFGIDAKKESLKYLSGWTKGKTLEDKKVLLGEVHQTALRFIQTIEKSMEAKQSKGKTVSTSTGKVGSLMNDKPNQATIKTLNNWERGSLTDYLQVGDRVDNALKNHLMNILPPRVNNERFIQVGEPYGFTDGKNTYITLAKEGSDWVYKGACFAGENYSAESTSTHRAESTHQQNEKQGSSQQAQRPVTCTVTVGRKNGAVSQNRQIGFER